MPFKGFYRALIPSFPTKNHGDKGWVSHTAEVSAKSHRTSWWEVYSYEHVFSDGFARFRVSGLGRWD